MPEIHGLRKAQKNKNDEFYTSLEDIEKEMKYYKEQFKDKIIFCNCDDPYESNFFKYFAMNFNALGLKKIITTCYAGSPIITEQLSLFDVKGIVVSKTTERNPYKIEITEVPDSNGDGAIDLSDVEYLIKNKKNTLTLLKGDGDFRSKECIKLLKEADIVVTNPPFSLFREYVEQLEMYNKKYLIIGNVNAIAYRDFFHLIKDNKVWMGASIHSGDREFRVPDSYPLNASGTRVDEKGNKYIRVKGVRWWTNLDYKERHEKMILYKRYTPEEYPKFDNYDAINVDKVSDIPCDYDGMMGVPITFLDKYNPEQFKIIASSQTGCHPDDMVLKKYSEYYGYTQDRKSNGRTGATMGNNPILVKDDKKHVYYENKDGIRVQSTYCRIFIIRNEKEGEQNGN